MAGKSYTKIYDHLKEKASDKRRRYLFSFLIMGVGTISIIYELFSNVTIKK